MEIIDKALRTETGAIIIEPICENIRLLKDDIRGMTAVIFPDGDIVYTAEPWEYINWGLSRYDRMVKDISETIYFA